MEKLYDISEVCATLGTTSRTLRYYEDMKLIESTVIPPSARRKYSKKQVNAIKNVLALRTLGLSVKTIKELTDNQTSLKEAVLLHRAKLFALIKEKQKQINLLEEVLNDINTDTITDNQLKSEVVCTEKQLEISEICTEAIINESYDTIVGYFSDYMRIMLPANSIEQSLKMQTEPLGEFISKTPPCRDENCPNIVIQVLRHENMSFAVKYVFHGNTICGFWLDYV